MRLLYTSDGLVGVKFGRAQVKWYNSIEQALPPIYSHYARQAGSVAPQYIREDIGLAINEMVKNKHDYAEFGIFGSLIYTGTDDEQVFKTYS